MLRRWVIGFGLGLIGLAALLLLTGHRDGGLVAMILWGIVLTAGIYADRFRYKAELARPPGPGWVRTEEKSVDSDGVVTVWFNPATGEREYVRRAGRAP